MSQMLGHAPVMTTTPPYDDDRLEAVLRIYADDPLDDGDAVLFLDGKVCLEITGLASDWDSVMSSNTASILRQTARSVVVAIARTGATPQPGDFQLWRDLHAELRGSEIELHPLHVLPAA